MSNVLKLFKRAAVHGYNRSTAHIIAPNASDDVKAAYAYGSWAAILALIMTYSAYKAVEVLTQEKA